MVSPFGVVVTFGFLAAAFKDTCHFFIPLFGKPNGNSVAIHLTLDVLSDFFRKNNAGALPRHPRSRFGIKIVSTWIGLV